MAGSLITGAMINRALGTSGRGVYAEMQTWIGLFSVLFGISLDTAIYHFANRKCYGEDDKARFMTVTILSVVASLVAMLCLTLFVVIMPEQVSPETASFLVVLDLLLVGTMMVTNLTVLLQALGNVRLSALIGLAQAATSLAIIVPAYFTEKITLLYVISVLTTVQLVGFFIASAHFLRIGSLSAAFSSELGIGMIKAGLKQHVATIATFTYMKINQLIVFRYCGEAEAGIFAVALNLALAVMFIPLTFQTALYPRVIHSTDDYEITIRSMRVGLYGWGIVTMLIVLCAEPLLMLYGGREFLKSVTIFRILMVASWLLPLSSLIAPYYIKVGAFGIASASAAGLGVISIGLNMLLVPRYASSGAAMATALSCLTGFCMTLFFLRYLSGKNPMVIFRPDFGPELAIIKQINGPWKTR